MREKIAAILAKQATQYIAKKNAKVIAVVGSVGKTSTTQAIATVLSPQQQVVQTLKNYNTDVGVPCSVFGQYLPGNLKNPFVWLYIILKNRAKIMFDRKSVDVFVLELGTDVPGEIAWFSWLKPDIAVVTAIAPEHMEYFKTLDAVAEEELAVAGYSDKVLINSRMIDDAYLQLIDNDDLYQYDRDDLKHFGLKSADLQVIGEHSVDSVVAGLKCGELLGLDQKQLQVGARQVVPQAGRMQQLEGKKDTTIVDDTYNSSPEAVMAALDHVYKQKAPQRIALLGNMNEMGVVSKELHTQMGAYCDPKKLDLVVTLGPDANKYMAPAAQKKGCKVVMTDTPYEAGEVITKAMKKGALILCKGSQNKVYAEEAVKPLLRNSADVHKLVRQSPDWIVKKVF